MSVPNGAGRVFLELGQHYYYRLVHQLFRPCTSSSLTIDRHTERSACFVRPPLIRLRHLQSKLLL
jgi:hypothetical protein